MTAKEVRKKYIEFFKSPPRNHKEIAPAPLVLENDPTTLFTSSGMQPLVPYLLGKDHPEGKRLVDSQPSIRLQDIEEVGDNRHTTFFEMLGNWSLGDYFKKEQQSWIWEFFVEELGLPAEKLYVSVFEGNDEVPRDDEAVNVWKSLGVSEDHIYYYDAKKNWWARTDYEKMPVGEPGGPSSEVFFEFTQVEHDPRFGEKCHPNCDCGRFMEIGNNVFMTYRKTESGFKLLEKNNIDFGGGLERLAAATNNDPDVFKTDLFLDLIHEAEKLYGVTYGNKEGTTRSLRILVEHLRASAMLISSGVSPGNKAQGYVLRRLLRKALFHSYLLAGYFKEVKVPNLSSLTDKKYPLKLKSAKEIEDVIREEMERFFSSLKKGVAVLQGEIKDGKINGKLLFNLYQSYGIPFELSLEILQGEGLKLQTQDLDLFQREFDKHKEASRTASAGMFKGGLADKSEETTKLHTATHLLHASLRKVLGEHVQQKGSNITAARLRFDFSHSNKLTDDEMKKVENLINEQIKKDLPVSFETKTYDEAVVEGALAFFGEKYGEKVNVYTIGNPQRGYFSKEVCGGPHVSSTGVLKHVRITKQEKIGSGLIRVYAQAEP